MQTNFLVSLEGVNVYDSFEFDSQSVTAKEGSKY